MMQQAQGLPDFVIIGSSKCGTTAIWKELRRHPAFHGSRIKETDYFASQFEFRDAAWYKGLFTSDGRINFEASPEYTALWYSHTVPVRMHALIPDARLIFMVRHPVDRIVSRALHRIWKGELPYQRLLDIRFWKRNVYAREAIAGSQYDERLMPFLEFYDLSQVLILKYESLKHTPVAFYNELLDVFGVQESRYREGHTFIHANVTATKKRPHFRKLHRRLKKWHRKGWLPPAHRLFESDIPRSELPIEILDYLWNQTESHLRQFETLTNQQFDYHPHWRTQL